MNQYVAPSQTRPARLASLPKLPIFLDLQDKQVLIAGSGEAAAWKAELFAAAGALVTVCAPEICPELSALIASGRRIAWTARSWRPEDFDDVWIAVTEPREDGAEFAAAARSRGVLVNVIDEPASCDFQFGTIVNRAPVVIGISTDGAAPILGQALRRKIEAVLPASLGGWAAAAKQFRHRLKEVVPTRGGRRRFWEAFVNITFVSQSDEDARLERLERLAREIAADKTPVTGEVIIVGAGPGDPELLTMRAVRELQAADVIVYDRLVSVDALELARREARRILVGKRGYGEACSQEEINTLLVRLAREGNRVVRLKGGDPAIFARTNEEASACRDAQIPVKVVPGVTTASAAAASLGISLTERELARRVQFVTGHDAKGELPTNLNISAMCDPYATTVVYMGLRTLPALAHELISRGLDGGTPVAIGSAISHPQQSWQTMSLANASNGEFDVTSEPSLIIVGHALASAKPA